MSDQTSTVPETFGYDPFPDPDFLIHPYPFYERIRQESPVASTSRGWIAVNYDDCRRLLMSEQTRQADPTEWQPREDIAGLDELQATVREWIGMSNPPDHKRRRGICDKAFSARTVKSMRDIVETAVNELIDGLVGQGSMDLVSEFTYPLPARVMGNLLGVPPEDHDKIRDWTHTIATTVDSMVDRATLEQGITANRLIQQYFTDLIEAKRSHPGDDLLSSFAQLLDAGAPVTAHELAANAVLVFHAGHRTTSATLSGGFVDLLQPHNQAQRDELQANPSLARGAVEEFLRYSGSAHAIWRVTVEDMEVGGHVIPAGATVIPLLMAACRDPEVYQDPQSFDIHRKMPRPHLAFGAGSHYCIGAPLARLESEIATETLLRRLPGLRLEELSPPMAPAVIMRGPTRVLVSY